MLLPTVALLLLTQDAALTPHSKPEHTLAGIHVGEDSIATVIHHLGRPNKIEDHADLDGPVGRGDRSYYWFHGATTLRVDTHYASPDKIHPAHEGPVLTVDLFGDRAAGESARTGRGLRIGAKLSHAHSLYGIATPSGETRLALQWPDGTRMTIDSDSGGRVTHIQITVAPAEDDDTF